ncbi:MAG: pilin [Patescibacteria group bacterium]
MIKPKILKLVLTAAVFLSLCGNTIGSATPAQAQADTKPAIRFDFEQTAPTDQKYTPLDYYPSVPLPVTGSGLDQASTTVGSYKDGVMTSSLLARYVKAIYDYGLAVAGILATLVLMGGGVLWLISGGNESRITQAKELIAGSITGLVILFCSWIILNTINPDLLKMKVITTQVIPPAKSQIACEWKCIDVGSKCEGGGGHDTIAATSPWRSTNQGVCNSLIGGVPATACSTGKLYDCCCRNEVKASEDEAASMIACLNNAAKPLPEHSSCEFKGTNGYCKTFKDPNGVNKIKCVPCSQTGNLCAANTQDYECANQQGLCGTGKPNGKDNDKYQGGDCNASPRDGNFFTEALGSIESSVIACNDENNLTPIVPLVVADWIFGIDLNSVYVECKCK